VGEETRVMEAHKSGGYPGGEGECLLQVKSSMPFVAMRPVGRAIAAVLMDMD
jgi:hypothetical protein